MFWLALLVSAAVIAALYFRWRTPEKHKLSEKFSIPGPCYPIIGHSYMFRGTDEDRMTAFKTIGSVALQQGGFSTFWMGYKLYFAVADPEAMEVVAKTCLEKDDTTMKYLRVALGNGIIFAPAKIWRSRRKIMAPTFNMRNLQQFVQVFNNQSSIMVELLDKHAGKGDFSIWKYITTYTFDAICESALGLKLGAQKQPEHEFIVAFDRAAQVLSQRILSPWLYWDWVFRLTSLHKKFYDSMHTAQNFCDEMIQIKRKAMNNQEDKTGASENGFKTFLDLMIESSGGAKGYSDLELREEVLAIVSAGTDTSAVGTAFTTVMLSRYPHVQEKVYQELRDVFGDTDRPVTWEDLPKLKYLEVVIKETLRLYPPAPVVVRDVHETVVLPSGDKLVPGMALLLHFWSTHRNTKYWGDDAEQFRPERFLEEPLRHPAQFVPFSYSLRNCIGANYALMSTKTNLSNLLRRYKVLPPASVPAEKIREPLKVQFDIMMKHVDNFEVRLEHRKKTV